jgi:hypothetical protein
MNRSSKFLLTFLIVFSIVIILASVSYIIDAFRTYSYFSLPTEERQVLNFVLGKQFSGSQIRQVILNPETDFRVTSQNPDDIYLYLIVNIHNLQSETLQNFKKQNQKSYKISSFCTSINCSFLTITERDLLLSSGTNQAWKNFYLQYPYAQGITTLSRVGFNHNQSQALVYLRTETDNLSHQEIYFVLMKENGNWRIDAQLII